MNDIDNQIQSGEVKKSFNLVIFVIVLLVCFAGGTYAYFTYSDSDSSITGNAGHVDLGLTVTKVLPTVSGVDNILIIGFDEVASSLNSGCVDEEYALCQIYKVHLVNNSGTVNTNVKGSISFNNETAPNLSWIYLGTSYSSSTVYTNEMLGNTFNTASSDFASFIDSYLLESGDSIDFYILVWVNESEEEQLDEGSYSGVVRFEESNGNGVTAAFANN